MITSAEEFVALRTSEDPADQERATRDHADVSVWLAVVASYPSMRQWVAHNKTVPIEVLQDLASDPDPSVRWEVAGKRKLDPDLLSRLASDGDDSVRVRVARHPHTGTDLLTALCTDESWVVREAADEALRKRISENEA